MLTLDTAAEDQPAESGCEADDEPRGEVERLAEGQDRPAADDVGQEAEDEGAGDAPRYPREHQPRSLLQIQLDAGILRGNSIDTQSHNFCS